MVGGISFLAALILCRTVRRQDAIHVPIQFAVVVAKNKVTRSGPRWTNLGIFLVFVHLNHFFITRANAWDSTVGCQFTIECSQPEPGLSNSFLYLLLES